LAFKYFKYFEMDSIADGGPYEDDWEPETDITIKRLYIRRKTGAALTDTTFHLKIAETVHTHEVVPAAILGRTIEETPVLDIAVKAKAKFAFTFKNLEGAIISIMITLEVWE